MVGGLKTIGWEMRFDSQHCIHTKCGGVTCNSSLGEVESGKSEVQGSPELHSKFEAKDKGIGFGFGTSTGPDRPNQES